MERSASLAEAHARHVQHADRIAYVNEAYGDCKDGRGSLTEMGNIYLRFGKPNTVVKRHHDTEYYPYEIWHYHKAGRFNNKRFLFFAPHVVAECMELLHSDMLGERQNEDWLSQLRSRENRLSVSKSMENRLNPRDSYSRKNPKTCSSIPDDARNKINGCGRAELEWCEPSPDLPPSVLTHTPSDVAIWVVDNGSEDASVDWLKNNVAERVQVLELKENHGFAGATTGPRADRCRHVCSSNSDVRVEGDWVTPVLECMEQMDWDVASPRVVQRRSWIVRARRCGRRMDGQDGYPFCLGRIFNAVEPSEDWHARDREVFWASGACFFIRKSAWRKADGFDSALFAHMEEIDLCWRLKNEGHRVGCVGTVSVRHLGGGTLQTTSPFKTYLNFRNNLVIMLKNRDGFGQDSCFAGWRWMAWQLSGCFSVGTGNNFLL